MNGTSKTLLRRDTVNWEARYRELEILIEEKNERIRFLETEIGVSTRGHRYLNLSKQESTILRVLMKHRMPQKSTFTTAMYNGREYDADSNILGVFMCHVRRKLKPHGVEIKSVWGDGYYMTPESKQIVRDLLDGEL